MNRQVNIHRNGDLRAQDITMRKYLALAIFLFAVLQPIAFFPVGALTPQEGVHTYAIGSICEKPESTAGLFTHKICGNKLHSYS
jgi:hypothetical protein